MCKNQKYQYYRNNLNKWLLLNMIKNILKFVAFFVTIFSFQTVFAASIDHYEVTVNPETVSIWEAVDLNIEAVDKDGNVITDYEGTILIYSQSDKDAELPNSLEESTYTFKLSDEWSIKFENAVRFKEKWLNDIHVYDLEDDSDSVVWIAEVQVVEEIVSQNVDISILAPESGITIGKDEITVSWKTNKNHQVKIVLNGKNEVLTTSDNDWMYEKVIENLPDGKSSIKAIVLDSDDNEIWNSKEVQITSDASVPTFNTIKILPSEQVPASSDLTIEVYAAKGLTDVSIILNDELSSLEEEEDWVYRIEIKSPKEVWDFPVDVILKDELGHIIKELWAKEITTTELEAAEEPEEPKKKDKCSEGDYTGSVFDWECWEKPEDYNAPIDLGIKDLKIVTLKTKSVLTWLKLDDASKYEVYRKMEWDELELIETVTEPMFEIALSWDVVKHEYFAVKAIWEKEFADSEDSEETITKEINGDLSDAIKVQTGPKEIILVLIALILWFWFILIKRKNA